MPSSAWLVGLAAWGVLGPASLPPARPITSKSLLPLTTTRVRAPAALSSVPRVEVEDGQSPLRREVRKGTALRREVRL